MSNFRLYPVPQSKLGILHKIISDRLAESNLTERSNADECIERVDNGYTARYMAAYVDDIRDPKCCLVMSHFPGIATSETIAHISLIYISPEKRGSAEMLAGMLSTAESYARLHGAGVLAGTSWQYRGSKSTDDLWKRNGFEIQETIFVKHLT